MGSEPHVAAAALWGYTNGTVNLNDNDFEHLLVCIDCQSLVSQFIEVLDHLPNQNPSQAA
jgi:hypothetical protein